jgi:hypothetical protein
VAHSPAGQRLGTGDACCSVLAFEEAPVGVAAMSKNPATATLFSAISGWAMGAFADGNGKPC